MLVSACCLLCVGAVICGVGCWRLSLAMFVCCFVLCAESCMCFVVYICLLLLVDVRSLLIAVGWCMNCAVCRALFVVCCSLYVAYWLFAVACNVVVWCVLCVVSCMLCGVRCVLFVCCALVVVCDCLICV